MKKGILVLGLVLSLSLVACGTTDNNNMKTEELPVVSETTNESTNDSSEEDTADTTNNTTEENTVDETNNTTDNETVIEVETEDMTVFNKESLAAFNGKDGQPGYVAVNGVVYDVSDVAAWQVPHAGRFEPGKDYSTEIGQSPHGLKNLENLEVIGTYED